MSNRDVFEGSDSSGTDEELGQRVKYKLGGNPINRNSTLNASDSDDERKCCDKCSLCCICVYIAQLFTCFGKMFAWIRGVYGVDEDWDADGQSCIWKCCCGTKNQHRRALVQLAVSNIVDLVMDAIAVVKWLLGFCVLCGLTNTEKNADAIREYLNDPTADSDVYWEQTHKWEAIALICCIAMSSIISTLVMLFRDVGTKPKRCCYEGVWWRIPFHLVGLGPTVEAIRGCGDWTTGKENHMTNIQMYKWVELICETCPSAVLSIYVTSKQTIHVTNWGMEMLTFENVMFVKSILMISMGFAGLFVKDIPKDSSGDGNKKVGQRGWLRHIVATWLVIADLIFRILIIIMWMNWNPIEGLPTVAWFGVIFATFYFFEALFIVINGRFPGVCSIWIVSYVNTFQGSVYWFSRKWDASVENLEEREENNHSRTILTFWIRWFFGWAMFGGVYLYAEGDISGNFIYPTLIAGGVLPLFFFLKPPQIPWTDAYPVLKKAVNRTRSDVSDTDFDELEGGCCCRKARTSFNTAYSQSQLSGRPSDLSRQSSYIDSHKADIEIQRKRKRTDNELY